MNIAKEKHTFLYLFQMLTERERERILYEFASHHDIMTQPQLLSCYIINFNDPIHLISIRPIVHLIHFLYHSPYHI